VFDLENYPLIERISDPDIIKAFEDKLASFKPDLNAKAILLSFAHGWNEEDIQKVSTLPVDEYYALFKMSESDELRKIINGCLQFDRISNATEPMKRISARAKEALRRIGLESPINARRVMRYGINIDDGLIQQRRSLQIQILKRLVRKVCF
jgi:hypothetical protein